MALGRNAALVLALAAVADGTQTQVTSRANPIRRVVNMLQAMAKKVEKEGEKQEELFEKFFCYCKNGKGALEQSISDAETKIPQLEASIKETAGLLEQIEGDIKKAKSDKAEAKTAVAEATSLRDKEAKAFAASSSEMNANIAAMGKAIAALEKGTGAAFLQSSSAALIRKLTINADIDSGDRETLSAFLSMNSDSDEAEESSGQIIGILKQMKETMEGDLADATKAEEESKTSFDQLVASKNKEIEALTQSIEEKITRNGESAVELTNMKEDLADTSSALEKDKAFLGDLDKNCATKKEEFEGIKKMRAEEQVAIADTIKLLNDDDALDLFKKTLPGSASLLQLQENSQDMKAQAVKALASRKHHDSRLDLISLALKGKKVSFDKVIGMIDEMVGILGSEQKDDDAKKEYCEAEMDKTEDELKELKLKGSDIAKAIEENKGNIATLADEIVALETGVKKLDKEVAEATENRKAENAEFKETLAGNTAAVDLLGMAKNRLNKFYNPKLYKAPPKRELSEEDRIAVNFGGTAPPTPAPGGIAGTGITALAQADPGPAPETGEYKKSGEESNGVIAMMDMLIADVEKENTEMEVEEKNAQEEYEQFMSDSAAKRSADLKSVEEKEGAKAEAEGIKEKLAGESKATLESEMATAEILGALHKECDWLLQNFDVRKEARASEVEALKKAKAVLSGADYSFIQQRVVRRHMRGGIF